MSNRAADGAGAAVGVGDRIGIRPRRNVKVPVPVYGPVPPVALTVTVVVPPKQAMAGPTTPLACSTGGSVTMTVVSLVQPLASVTVYLYVPAVTVNVPVPL